MQILKTNKLIIIAIILIKICLIYGIKIHNEINMIHNMTSYIIIQIMQELNISENTDVYLDIDKLHIKIDTFLYQKTPHKILENLTIFISQLYMLKNPMALWEKILLYGKAYYYTLPHLMNKSGYVFPPLFMQFYFIKYMFHTTLEWLLLLNLCLNIFIIVMFIYYLLMSILKLKLKTKYDK